MARSSRINVFTVTNGAGGTEFLGPSPNRVAIRFETPGSGTVWWSNEDTIAQGGGIAGNSGNPGLVRELHGEIVTHAWRAIGSGASQTASVTETIDSASQG